MRLVLLEYLRMLRESGEFDVLLPDLLLAMNIVPVSKPQIGVRQAGVDLAAVGPDESGVATLWIFVLKRGDLGRRDWDTGPQAVRQSLDEIKDTYLRNNIAPEYKNLPVRIVVATTGDFKQDFEQQRAGYSAANTLRDRTYAFWTGDRVAALIEEHLFNEYALPASARSELRRALALVGEPDYELGHFFAMLEFLLAWDADDNGAMKSEKDCLRDLHTISLALGILCRWAAQDGNLKSGVIAGERAMLWAWDAMRRRDFTQNRNMVHGYIRITSIYLNTTVEYFNKVQSHLHTRDAFARYHREAALLTERVFEEVGLLATIGLVHFLWGVTVKDDERVAGAMAVADSLAEFLQSHKITASPCYDGQSIDIALALTFLFLAKQVDPLKMWLRELTTRLAFGYRKGQWFPISTDSFDDLVDLELGDGDFSKLTETSWMVPMLAEWSAVIEEDETYLHLAKLKDDLKNTSFQVWYPDEKTAELLYARRALDTGVTEAPIDLPATAEEMRARMRKIQTESPVKTPFESSATKAGIGWLDFVASRHFRTPRDPAFWQKMALATESARASISGEPPPRFPERENRGADGRGFGA